MCNFLLMSGSKGDFYKTVSDKLWKEAESSLLFKEDTNNNSRRFVELFLNNYHDEGSSMKYQSLLLEPFKKKTTHNSSIEPKLRKLSKRQKKKLELMKLTKEEQEYSLYIPLHELWKEYINELFKGTIKNTQTLAQKILKADLHGCIIKVIDSKCSSIVGLEGIIIIETQNTFRIVSTDNRIKTIPKGRTVFTFTVAEHEFTLYGQNLLFRAGDRSSRKFKDKPFVDL